MHSFELKNAIDSQQRTYLFERLKVCLQCIVLNQSSGCTIENRQRPVHKKTKDILLTN